MYIILLLSLLLRLLSGNNTKALLLQIKRNETNLAKVTSENNEQITVTSIEEYIKNINKIGRNIIFVKNVTHIIYF